MQVGTTSLAHSQTRKLAELCPAGKGFHSPVGITAGHPSCGSWVYMRVPHAELPELHRLVTKVIIHNCIKCKENAACWIPLLKLAGTVT